MMKPSELINKVFMTNETRIRIREEAAERDEREIKQYEEDFYNALDKVMKMIAVMKPDEKEYIIYTPERAIGKTKTLLKLSNEYNAAIVADVNEKRRLEQMKKELGYKKGFIFTVQEFLKKDVLRKELRTILKSESVKMKDVRKLREEYYIVGIEDI